MSIEPAINSVVEVFMDRRQEYLPRLQRIAEILAECAGATIGKSAVCAFEGACQGSKTNPGRAEVRFSVGAGEVSAECREAAKSPAEPKSRNAAPESSAKVDFCLLR